MDNLQPAIVTTILRYDTVEITKEEPISDAFRPLFTTPLRAATYYYYCSFMQQKSGPFLSVQNAMDAWQIAKKNFQGGNTPPSKVLYTDFKAKKLIRVEAAN